MNKLLSAVYVAQCDLTTPPPQLNFAPRQAQIDDCTNLAVKCQKYAVWKLLEYAVKQYLGISIYDCNPVCSNGRWSADGIYFSLSHSGNTVAVAVGKSPIGVDVQQIDTTKFDDKLANRVLTANEKPLYDTAPNKTETLAEIWAKKEAIFKFGNQTTLCQIDTTLYPNATSEIHELFGTTYAVAICTQDVTTINLQIATPNK